MQQQGNQCKEQRKVGNRAEKLQKLRTILWAIMTGSWRILELLSHVPEGWPRSGAQELRGSGAQGWVSCSISTQTPSVFVWGQQGAIGEAHHHGPCDFKALRKEVEAVIGNLPELEDTGESVTAPALRVKSLKPGPIKSGLKPLLWL